MMTKKHNGATYLFAVAMRGDKTTATFTLRHAKGIKTAQVIGENRKITIKNSVFQDNFDPWDVHLYRMQ
jgi:hypothetical protein